MTGSQYKRKLSAILNADVKGYSRLMGEDEESTVHTLKAYRELFSDHTRHHRGRVVDSPGDNILAEFESVVDAVRCGLEIQKDLSDKNNRLPKERRMEFRIGINLGDVIHEEGRIYGDGVNVAARIESLADPGGICLSRSAYDQIKGKLKVGFEYLGEHPVKNISEPVRVYRVLTDPEDVGKVIGESKPVSRKWGLAAIGVLFMLLVGLAAWFFVVDQPSRVESASLDNLAFPLPEEPSVAVLPFKDLTGDESHRYMVSGTTDAVRIALARIPNLFVMDHNSLSRYRDKAVEVKQVAEDMGVRYVVEGSVQQSGDKTRINAKLIDALSGKYVWADTYIPDENELFGLQDEISQKIATELEVHLTEGEQARIWYRQTDSLEAYRQFRNGKEHYRKRTKQDNILARSLYGKAITLDPNYAEAKCHLGFTYIQDALNGWTKNKREAFSRARELAREAIKLDPNYPHAYALLGSVYLFEGEREKALELISRSIDLEPNYAGNIAMQALTLVYLERPDEAFDAIESAIRLNPYYPHWYLGVLGRIYLLTDRYHEAVDAFESRRKRSKSALNLVELSIANIMAGKEDAASAVASKLLKTKPNFRLTYLSMFFQYENPETGKRFMAAAQKAGFPL